jgi:hypothetical protein
MRVAATMLRMLFPACRDNVLWSSEEHNRFSISLRLIRIFVTMIVKVSFLELPVRRLWRTMSEQFQCVGSLAIVVPLVASMSFRFYRPSNHLVPVAALSNLAITNMMSSRCRHRRIIRHAHNVLSQTIQTVVNVTQIETLCCTIVLGYDSFANEFLWRD